MFIAGLNKGNDTCDNNVDFNLFELLPVLETFHFKVDGHCLKD